MYIAVVCALSYSNAILLKISSPLRKQNSRLFDANSKSVTKNIWKQIIKIKRS